MDYETSASGINCEFDGYAPLDLSISVERQGKIETHIVGNSGLAVVVLESIDRNFMHYTPEGSNGTAILENRRRQHAITFLGALGSYVQWLDMGNSHRLIDDMTIYTETNQRMAEFISRNLGSTVYRLLNSHWGEHELEIYLKSLLSNKHRSIFENYLLPMKQVAETSNFLVMST